MTPTVTFVDWGTVPYAEALARQRELFEAVIAAKAGGRSKAKGRSDDGGGNGEGNGDDREDGDAGTIVMCEHLPVYTLGRSGKAENLLVGEDFLRAKGAELYRTDRGGDITFHGQGQLVCYPIVDLERLGIGLRDYVDALEQSVIETVAEFGIEAGRREGKTGVWVAGGEAGVRVAGSDVEKGEMVTGREGKTGVRITGNECKGVPVAGNEGGARTDSKICAIGVRSSRFVTMHGLALNVSTDLGWFAHINPCGFSDGRVTSIDALTGKKTALEKVKGTLAARLAANLGVSRITR